MPGGPIGELLEMGAREETRVQVLRILDDRRHYQPAIAVVFRSEDIEVLGEQRVPAERHAVLSQVSRPDVPGDDLERANRFRRRPAEHATAAPAQLLCCE